MASPMLTELAAMSQDTITELGQSVTFSRAAGYVVNGPAGTSTSGTPTTSAAKVMVIPSANDRAESSAVTKRMRHLLVAPSIDFTPRPGDTLSITEDSATINLRVAKCDPTNVDGATPLLFDVDAMEV